MKSRFVETEKANYPVSVICRMLKFSPKSYYAWRTREPSARQLETERLLVQIREAFELGRGTYGSPRVHAELQQSGIAVGLNRVAALMRAMGLCVRPRKGFRVSTSEQDPAHEIAPNVLARDFTATAPKQKWVADVTFIETGEGWLYLATMIDLYNREIVGWAVSDRNDQRLTRQCLDMALDGCASAEQILHHTDRGSTGGFNRSLQHSNEGVNDVRNNPTTSVRSCDASADALPRPSNGVRSPTTSAVLASDRRGSVERSRRRCRRGVPGSRLSLVSRQ